MRRWKASGLQPDAAARHMVTTTFRGNVSTWVTSQFDEHTLCVVSACVYGRGMCVFLRRALHFLQGNMCCDESVPITRKCPFSPLTIYMLMGKHRDTDLENEQQQHAHLPGL